MNQALKIVFIQCICVLAFIANAVLLGEYLPDMAGTGARGIVTAVLTFMLTVTEISVVRILMKKLKVKIVFE